MSPFSLALGDAVKCVDGHYKDRGGFVKALELRQCGNDQRTFASVQCGNRVFVALESQLQRM